MFVQSLRVKFMQSHLKQKETKYLGLLQVKQDKINSHQCFCSKFICEIHPEPSETNEKLLKIHP